MGDARIRPGTRNRSIADPLDTTDPLHDGRWQLTLPESRTLGRGTASDSQQMPLNFEFIQEFVREDSPRFIRPKLRTSDLGVMTDSRPPAVPTGKLSNAPSEVLKYRKFLLVQ